MAGQIAILEGYKMPRRRRRHRRRYSGVKQTTKLGRAAKICSRVVRRSGGSFKACMRRHLKKHRR